MEETEQNLTAVTSEFGDERPDYGLGVSIRCNGIEVDYLHADGLEEHAPLDWTPDMAMVLLGEHGYQVTGTWTDISGICVEDPIWETPVAVSDVVVEHIGDAVTFQCSPQQAVELLLAIRCDDDCPTCLYGE